MSEGVALGESDATTRLLGLSRHQVALLALGAGLLADAILRSRLVGEAAIAVLALLGAAPAGEASVGERVALALGYLARSHVTSVALERDGGVVVHAGASVATRGFRLEHRGRLDLSGADVARAHALGEVLDALATAPGGRHASLHVTREGDVLSSVLCLESGRAPEGWRRDDDAIARLVGVDLAEHLWLFERPGYLRSARAVARVLRVRDFSAASVPLLAALQRTSRDTTLALHVDVFGEASARRHAERRSHAATSNEAAAGALGFRETSRVRRRVARTLERETRVAQGRALARLGVFVTVFAARLDELDDAVGDVLAAAREGGVVVDRGWGRQAQWFRFQLPGGPHW
jgi:hypothetical protein